MKKRAAKSDYPHDCLTWR